MFDEEYKMEPELKLNYYEILGVERNADDDTIRQAFKKLARIHHPDKGGNLLKFQEINIAHDVLGNYEKRMLYNLSLQTGGSYKDYGDGPTIGEVHPASGSYIVTQSGVLVRTEPAPNANIHGREFLLYGDLFEIKASFQQGSTLYFELKDGGWIFARNGNTVMVEETTETAGDEVLQEAAALDRSIWTEICFVLCNTNPDDRQSRLRRSLANLRAKAVKKVEEERARLKKKEAALKKYYNNKDENQIEEDRLHTELSQRRIQQTQLEEAAKYYMQNSRSSSRANSRSTTPVRDRSTTPTSIVNTDEKSSDAKPKSRSTTPLGRLFNILTPGSGKNNDKINTSRSSTPATTPIITPASGGRRGIWNSGSNALVATD